MFFNYHFFGMDLIWWVTWSILILLFFSFFQPVRRKKTKRNPFDVLQHKFSTGEISADEYELRKRVLEIDKNTKLRMYFLSEPYRN
jgi:putative membrane protein